MQTATQKPSRPSRTLREAIPRFAPVSKVQIKFFAEWKKVCAVKGWKAHDKALRRAFTAQVIGFACSSDELRPSHWDRIFPALALLADSTDLDAAIQAAALEIHDAAQAAHVPVVQLGKRAIQRDALRQKDVLSGRSEEIDKRGCKKKERGAPARTHASEYEKTTLVDDPGERKRLLWFINTLFQPAYIESVARDLYDDVVWDELPIPKLLNLQHALHNRLSKWLTTAKKAPGFLEKYRLEHVYFAPQSRYPWPSNEACIAELLKVGKPVDLREGKAETTEDAEEGNPF